MRHTVLLALLFASVLLAVPAPNTVQAVTVQPTPMLTEKRIAGTYDAEITVHEYVDLNNTLENPGFETGSTSPWYIQTSALSASVATDNPHSGSYSLKAIASLLAGVSNSVSLLIRQDLSSGKNISKITLYYYFNKTGNTGDAVDVKGTMTIRLIRENEVVWYDEVSLDDVARDVWIEYSHRFLPPLTDIDRITITFDLHLFVPGSGYVDYAFWVDDITMINATTYYSKQSATVSYSVESGGDGVYNFSSYYPLSLNGYGIRVDFIVPKLFSPKWLASSSDNTTSFGSTAYNDTHKVVYGYVFGGGDIDAQFTAPNPVTVLSTNKKYYLYNETVYVTLRLTLPDGTPLSGEEVWVWFGNTTSYNLTTVVTDEEGYAYASFTAWGFDANLTVQAECYGWYKGVRTIEVHSTSYNWTVAPGSPSRRGNPAYFTVNIWRTVDDSKPSGTIVYSFQGSTYSDSYSNGVYNGAVTSQKSGSFNVTLLYFTDSVGADRFEFTHDNIITLKWAGVNIYYRILPLLWCHENGTEITLEFRLSYDTGGVENWSIEVVYGSQTFSLHGWNGSVTVIGRFDTDFIVRVHEVDGVTTEIEVPPNVRLVCYSPPAINITPAVNVTVPGVGNVYIDKPSLYTPQGIITLGIFLGIFILYNNKMEWYRALALASAISLIFSTIFFSLDLMLVFTVLFTLGLALSKSK